MVSASSLTDCHRNKVWLDDLLRILILTILSISVWTVPVLSGACAFPETNHQEWLIFFLCVWENLPELREFLAKPLHRYDHLLTRAISVRSPKSVSCKIFKIVFSYTLFHWRNFQDTSEGKENNGRGMQRCPRIVALKNILSQCWKLDSWSEVDDDVWCPPSVFQVFLESLVHWINYWTVQVTASKHSRKEGWKK